MYCHCKYCSLSQYNADLIEKVVNDDTDLVKDVVTFFLLLDLHKWLQVY